MIYYLACFHCDSDASEYVSKNVYEICFTIILMKIHKLPFPATTDNSVLLAYILEAIVEGFVCRQLWTTRVTMNLAAL